MNLEGAQVSLDRALDHHIEVLETVVALSQREQQHLIAFEIHALDSLLDDKRALLGQVRAADTRTRDAALTLRVALDVTMAQAPTLRALVGTLPDSSRSGTKRRVDNLRALAQSLDELQAMSRIHADRGVRTVQAYAALLVSAGLEPETAAYDSAGRSRPLSRPVATFARTV